MPPETRSRTPAPIDSVRTIRTPISKARRSPIRIRHAESRPRETQRTGRDRSPAKTRAETAPSARGRQRPSTQTVRRMRNHCMQRKGNGRHVRPAKRIPTCQRRLAFDRKRRRFGRAGIGSVGRTSAGRHLLAATDEGARAQKPLGDVGACRSPKLDGGTMSNNQWHGHSLTRFSRIAYTQFKYTFPWENMLDFRRREAENPPNFRRRKGDKTAPRSRREANSGRSRRPTAQKSAAARNARSCKDGHSRAAAAAHRARRKWFELEFKLELGLQLQLQPELGFELKLEPEFGPSPSSNSNPSPNPS